MTRQSAELRFIGNLFSTGADESRNFCQQFILPYFFLSLSFYLRIFLMLQLHTKASLGSFPKVIYYSHRQLEIFIFISRCDGAIEHDSLLLHPSCHSFRSFLLFKAISVAEKVMKSSQFIWHARASTIKEKKREKFEIFVFVGTPTEAFIESGKKSLSGFGWLQLSRLDRESKSLNRARVGF